MAGQGGEGLVKERVLLIPPRGNGAFPQGQAVIGDDEVGVEMRFRTQPVTGRAGSHRGVEGEEAGFHAFQHEAGFRAGIAGGEGGLQRLTVFPAAEDFLDGGQTVREVQGGFKTVGQPGFHTVLQHHTVHHDIHVVACLAVQLRGVADLVERAINAYTGEATAGQLGQFLRTVALAVPHDRGQQHEPCAGGHGHHTVHHLADALGLDGQAGGRRVGNTRPCPEQAHVVVNFGDRADRRAWIAGGCFLLDGNGRREALDGINIRLAHQFQKLAGIGGEAFHIATLPFGIDGVEGEGGLAGAGKARQHGQPVPGDGDVDVPQVVRTGTTDDDVACAGRAGCVCHAMSSLRPLWQVWMHGRSICAI